MRELDGGREVVSALVDRSVPVRWDGMEAWRGPFCRQEKRARG